MIETNNNSSPDLKVFHISISEKNATASQREVIESEGQENASEGEEFQNDQVNGFIEQIDLSFQLTANKLQQQK
ncbi:hypothetical protein TTHERM_00185150 (macronuclear) [Tetrahymena thermophila SB210]|uniref:Uncharacterized protein n=1 Tax=Tetrahymena thermophila (strain SB210) TaxID=312017 RepID=Q22T97_TETTS|nr:hypothetical protein TTHERM_00185150 [Tetrahymena thermophila SB210]EAR88541.2 hypothetical protein TTHERM_00185150 [Tetrahymena thermophila SB210]|eukprot:XP_001008786.2 hypothetical protein TTHERM_00185150 [Tetrahymena thermophila SB210]